MKQISKPAKKQTKAKQNKKPTITKKITGHRETSASGFMLIVSVNNLHVYFST